MKKIVFALPMALILAAPAANSGVKELTLNEKDQTRFDKKIEGRVAGEPVSCISRIDQKRLTVVGDKYLIYQRSSNPKTIYINEPYGGCRDAEDNTLVTKRFSSRLCRGEIAEVKDLSTGIHYDSCSFGRFVPYTKEES